MLYVRTNGSAHKRSVQVERLSRGCESGMEYVEGHSKENWWHSQTKGELSGESMNGAQEP